jgi:hypothetical protein
MLFITCDLNLQSPFFMMKIPCIIFPYNENKNAEVCHDRPPDSEEWSREDQEYFSIQGALSNNKQAEHNIKNFFLQQVHGILYQRTQPLARFQIN